MAKNLISAFSQISKEYAHPTGEHISLGKPLRGVLFIVPFGIFALMLYRLTVTGTVQQITAIITAVIVGILWLTIVSGIRVAAQWERGVVLRLGNFQAVRGPGLLYVVPILEYIKFIDTRVLVVNIPHQKVITRDNVPAEIDGALFFMVKDSEKAVIRIQDFRFAIAQYAQAALRDVVGGLPSMSCFLNASRCRRGSARTLKSGSRNGACMSIQSGYKTSNCLRTLSASCHARLQRSVRSAQLSLKLKATS
jgi:hypothetical protein